MPTKHRRPPGIYLLIALLLPLSLDAEPTDTPPAATAVTREAANAGPRDEKRPCPMADSQAPGTYAKTFDQRLASRDTSSRNSSRVAMESRK